LFHGFSLWWRLIHKLRLVDMLFYHSFLYLEFSSSSSTLSLGFYRMVCSISVSIGRMVGFLDQSPYMNRVKFGSYNSFSTAMLMSLELHSITEGCALDCYPALDRT
jgi:hypothetical protein